MSDWQPIETAPRNHFPVLVWSVQYGCAVAFLDIVWQWFPALGDEPLPSPPTHWQPLPAPPSAAPPPETGR